MTLDPNVEAVRRKLANRAEAGLQKYGVTTERGDLNTLDWLTHAQEEALDLAVYLQRLIHDEQERQAQEAKPETPGWNVGQPVWLCTRVRDGAVHREKMRIQRTGKSTKIWLGNFAQEGLPHVVVDIALRRMIDPVQCEAWLEVYE